MSTLCDFSPLRVSSNLGLFPDSLTHSSTSTLSLSPALSCVIAKSINVCTSLSITTAAPQAWTRGHRDGAQEWCGNGRSALDRERIILECGIQTTVALPLKIATHIELSIGRCVIKKK